MAHSNTELLIDRWRAQSGPGGVPARTALDLAPFARLAPQLFVAGRGPAGQFPLRLVGEAVRDLAGRRLLGRDLMELFTLSGRIELRPALEAARRGRTTMIACVEERTEDGAACLELAFAPLLGPTGAVDRFLGHCQPLTPALRTRNAPLRELVLTGLQHGDADAPRLRLAALHGRQIAG